MNKANAIANADAYVDAELEVMPGGVNQVLRIGSTVRRPVGPWTASVHALLTHIAEAGYTGAGHDAIYRTDAALPVNRIAPKPIRLTVRSPSFQVPALEASIVSEVMIELSHAALLSRR